MKTNTLGEIKEKNTMLLLCVVRNNMLITILEQRKRRKCIRIAKTVEYAGGKDGLSCSKFHLWTCAWAAAIISSMSYIFFGPNIVPFMYNAIVFVIYGTTSQCVFPWFHELSKKQHQKDGVGTLQTWLVTLPTQSIGSSENEKGQSTSFKHCPRHMFHNKWSPF